MDWNGLIGRGVLFVLLVGIPIFFIWILPYYILGIR